MKAFATLIVPLALLACAPGGEGESLGGEETSNAAVLPGPARAVLEREIARIDAEAARIDSVFRPLPLLRPAQETALRRFGNPQHLTRAQALGVGRLLPPPRLEELRTEGALVVLEDTEFWIVRELDYSQPLAVPSVRGMLTELGERFQARLRELEVPPYRFEISSVLRTAADQEALRRVNPNAAAGESAHEYGTTVDVLYSAFSAPARPIVELDVAGQEWLEPYLQRYAVIAAERVAARRALELTAILGEVLITLQNEGKVMVTMERLQPVYHMTVARRY